MGLARALPSCAVKATTSAAQRSAQPELRRSRVSCRDRARQPLRGGDRGRGNTLERLQFRRRVIRHEEYWATGLPATHVDVSRRRQTRHCGLQHGRRPAMAAARLSFVAIGRPAPANKHKCGIAPDVELRRKLVRDGAVGLSEDLRRLKQPVQTLVAVQGVVAPGP